MIAKKPKLIQMFYNAIIYLLIITSYLFRLFLVQTQPVVNVQAQHQQSISPPQQQQQQAPQSQQLPISQQTDPAQSGQILTKNRVEMQNFELERTQNGKLTFYSNNTYLIMYCSTKLPIFWFFLNLNSTFQQAEQRHNHSI